MKTNKQRAKAYRERKRQEKKININAWIGKIYYLKLIYFANKKEVDLNTALEKIINKEKIQYSQMMKYFESLPEKERIKYLSF